MGNPSNPAPAPKENFLYEIHDKGAKADLTQLKEEIIDAKFINTERRYAKSLTSAQRVGLSKRIEEWREANEKAGPEKQEEQLKVMNLLHELRSDIEPPNVARAAGDVGEYVGDFAKNRVNDTLTAGGKILRKVTTDAAGLAPNNGVPWQDKVVTGAKYVAGAIGLLWLIRKANAGWNRVAGTKWYSQLAKGLAAISAFFFGTYVLSGTTDRSMGPRLVVPNVPSDMPGVTTGPNVLPGTVPTMDVLKTPDGVELLTPFSSSPRRTLNVAIDDKTSFKILDPVNEKTGTLDGVVEIDGQKYSIMADITGTPLDGPVTQLLSSVDTKSSAKDQLNMIKMFTGVRKNKDRISINLGGGVGGTIDIPLQQIKNVVETVKADKASSNVKTAVDAEYTWMGSTKAFPLPVSLKKI